MRPPSPCRRFYSASALRGRLEFGLSVALTCCFVPTKLASCSRRHLLLWAVVPAVLSVSTLPPPSAQPPASLSWNIFLQPHCFWKLSSACHPLVSNCQHKPLPEPLWKWPCHISVDCLYVTAKGKAHAFMMTPRQLASSCSAPSQHSACHSACHMLSVLLWHSVFFPGWDLSLIWISPPVRLYYSALVEWEDEGPRVSDVETVYVIEFGPPQGNRNESHGHQTTSNWGWERDRE